MSKELFISPHMQLRSVVATPIEQRSFLSRFNRKYIITAICIGSVIARDFLGFEKTAIAITSALTICGFTFFGLSLGLPIYKHTGNPKVFSYSAIAGGALGFTISLISLATIEGPYQMFRIIKNYIN